MILRRFMQHVKEQNWFAVGLDVIVVIVGIFLGLQVQAVYEERQNIAEERRLIDAMTIEVEELLAIRNAQLEELNTEQESVVEALAILFGEESTQKLTNKHCIGVRRSHSRSTAWNDIPITSVEEIVVSGKLNIIRNPELRTAILRLRSVSISVSSRIDLITSRDVILYSKFPELIQTKFNALHSGPLSIQAVCDFESIKLNPGILNDLQANRARKGALLNSAREELKAINEVLELVK